MNDRNSGPRQEGVDPFEVWLAALDARHLEVLTFQEVRRALQALSSLYVERRGQIGSGAALDSAGKRAAFALYYGPLHFLLVRQIVRALGAAQPAAGRILDLGCGTGAAGAAWALDAGCPLDGVERNAWAAAEARWTLQTLRLEGTVRQGDLGPMKLPGPGGAVLAAFTVNELEPSARQRLLERLASAPARGVSVLIVEPIARSPVPWWDEWAARFAETGGRTDEWRFPASLPPRLQLLAKAAGLKPRTLTGRSLWRPAQAPVERASTM